MTLYVYDFTKHNIKYVKMQIGTYVCMYQLKKSCTVNYFDIWNKNVNMLFQNSKIYYYFFRSDKHNEATPYGNIVGAFD